MTSPEQTEAYLKSIELLKSSSTPFGFVASINEISNYTRVWTRDATITGLASLLSGDKQLTETFKNVIKTIFDHQHQVGFMPSNVDPANGKVSYGGTVGRTDNVCWAPVGLLSYTLFTGDYSLSTQYRVEVDKCFALLNAWEYNGKGLVYVPQSGDWADEYMQHGYILYNQLLRIWALELAGKVYHDSRYLEKADEIRLIVELNYWKNTENTMNYAPNMIHQSKDISDEFWVMGFNPSRIYPQFDLQANSLALLLNIGNTEQKDKLLNYIITFIDRQQNLLPSFYPSLKEGDILYEDLRHNYAYEFRNFPDEFHNGGLWQVWNGFLSAALVSSGKVDQAEKVLEYIKQANLKNTDAKSWGFYENCNGSTFEPIGVQYCTWSASGQIIASEYINGKKLII
ncbi:glycoside hydrolase 100 family protein [Daejeonella oryzae]|uniref:glycoside hydrolase 100 family protein n=1 Tax=Daejeonella oryzae TaxID=1122943 RepID=UPI0003F9002F|nr:glycoside hydrolase 100 family protein [Daejeonella oryzae]